MDLLQRMPICMSVHRPTLMFTRAGPAGSDGLWTDERILVFIDISEPCPTANWPKGALAPDLKVSSDHGSSRAFRRYPRIWSQPFDMFQTRTKRKHRARMIQGAAAGSGKMVGAEKPVSPTRVRSSILIPEPTYRHLGMRTGMQYGHALDLRVWPDRYKTSWKRL